jgi:hypothetical protein
VSVRCMARVWAESEVGGSELLVLLAIADHAHDDGSGAWPSLTSIARKTKMSRRNVSRVISTLIEKGELRRDSGAGPYGTNAYTVLSGIALQSSRAVRCYMCGESEKEIIIEMHHPNPADRDFTVPLCKPCHIKIHNMQGIDKLSLPTSGSDTMSPVETPCPHNSDGDGQDVPSGRDKNEGVGTPRDKTRDIAMSPKPSLTSNHKPSFEPSSALWQKILDDLSLQMAAGTFDNNLRGSKLITADNGTWKIQVKRAGAVEWLDKRLRPTIERTVSRHAPGVELEFVA